MREKKGRWKDKTPRRDALRCTKKENVQNKAQYLEEGR